MTTISGNSGAPDTIPDALELSRALIRCPSVTPIDAGALDVLQNALEGLDFICHRLPFCEPGTADVDNLYARIGDGAPNICFAGHTDVVPTGDAEQWTSDPFAAEIRDNNLYGRGAVDMKCAIACFVAAAGEYLSGQTDFTGSISLLITGDEEGPAINGTRKALEWLEKRGETIDACIVGEPTNSAHLGDMIKIGRRGSLNARLSVQGVQGHTAYPQLADNPVPRLMAMLTAIAGTPMDEGSAHFPASTIAITTIDVGNETTNMIPALATAAFNVRFNDHHTGAGVETWLRRHCDQTGGNYTLDISITGESFLTPPGPLSDAIGAAVREVTGIKAELSTTGGTSDARFIKDYCPVAEFGLINETAHKVDEFASLADIHQLTQIYRSVLERYFKNSK